jgi:hypothetical protein
VKIPSHGIMYQTAGNHIAFGCSWGGDNPCSEGEYSDTLAFLTNACGSYVAGWIDIGDWRSSMAWSSEATPFVAVLLRFTGSERRGWTAC